MVYLLFYVCRLRVEGPRSKTACGYLRYQAASDACEGVDFPEKDLNNFCFPLGTDVVQPKEVQASEEYTFGLTYGDGRRFTGFARQIFPPAPRVGSKARYPQVLCLVAENPWCNFFFKVLQVAEQILKAGSDGLMDSQHTQLPLDSQLGTFLVDLRKQLATNPAPGEVLRVLVPNLLALQGISPPRYMGAGSPSDALSWSDDRIELQVPPDCGTGPANSGIPLARLFFHVPVPAMLTLIASLLLERRIIFVARSRDTVTAAVQAAFALIYPFKWHHIYLPLLPVTMVDYLMAPMPFLVGLPSDMLPLIRHVQVSEALTVDLDLQKLIPPAGSTVDDGRLLPYGRQLLAALEAVFKTVRSPTEYESSSVITGVMQEYFVRVFGSYRRFIHDQAMEPLLRVTASAGVSAAAGHGPWRPGHGHLRGREAREREREARGGNPAASESGMSPSGALGQGGRNHDDMLRGHGHYFDQPAFVVHRRSEAMRAFLAAMRHSQLYQMFIMERLQLAAASVLELPNTVTSGRGQSFSFAGPANGTRTRALGGGGPGGLGMCKSSSANNLAALERSVTGGGGGPGSSSGMIAPSGSGSAGGATNSTSMAMPNARGGASAGGVSASGAGAGPLERGSRGPTEPGLDSFELRVSRYPEHRRQLRERLRTLVAEAGPTGGGGGGPGGGGPGGSKLASKLRRHRRTDSEDVAGQQHAAAAAAGPGSVLPSGESMRRITTYPGPIDVTGVPSLADPCSFFAELDLHDEDDEESASPSPSPRDREHMRSWSGNSLHSADSAEGGAPGPGPSGLGGGAGGGGGGGGFGFGSKTAGRDREGGGTPQRRISVPLLATSNRGAYMSLLNTACSSDSAAGQAAPHVPTLGVTVGRSANNSTNPSEAGPAPGSGSALLYGAANGQGRPQSGASFGLPPHGQHTNAFAAASASGMGPWPGVSPPSSTSGALGQSGPSGPMGHPHLMHMSSMERSGLAAVRNSTTFTPPHHSASAGVEGVVTMEMRGGVQVQTLPDGHRVYDGSLKDIMKLAATEAKNGLLSGLAGLASPRNSPKGPREREGPPGAAGGGGRVGSFAATPQAAAIQQKQLAAAMAAAAAAKQVQSQHLHTHGTPLPPHATALMMGQIPLPGMPAGPGPGPGPALAGPSVSYPTGALAHGPVSGSASSITRSGAIASGPVSADGMIGRAPATSAPENRPLGAAAAAAASAGAVPGRGPSDSASGAEAGHGAGSEGGAHGRFSSILSHLSGLKDKVSTAGTGLKEKVSVAGTGLREKVTVAGTKALGILPTPSYKPQTTGEKAAKFKAQLTGGSGPSLLAGADGKLLLRQPHAPQRPLSLSHMQRANFPGNSGGSASAAPGTSHPAPGHAAYAATGYPGSSYSGYPGVSFATGGADGSGHPVTPTASPSPQTPPGPPRAYGRAQSMDGTSSGQLSCGVGLECGALADTNGAALSPPGSTPMAFRASASQLADLPLDRAWDPFGADAQQQQQEPATAPPAAMRQGVSPFADAHAAAAVPASVSSAGTSARALAAGGGSNLVGATGIGSGGCDAATADLLGLSLSEFDSAVSRASGLSGGASFDPFLASASGAASVSAPGPPSGGGAGVGVTSSSSCDDAPLESAGSNDFAAFASATSPHGPFPGSASNSAPLFG